MKSPEQLIGGRIINNQIDVQNAWIYEGCREYNWGKVWVRPDTVHPDVQAFVSDFIRNPTHRTVAVEPRAVITRVIQTKSYPVKWGKPDRSYVLVLDPFASTFLLRQGWRSDEALSAFIGHTPEQMLECKGKPFYIVVSPAEELLPTFPSTWLNAIQIARMARPDLTDQLIKHGQTIMNTPYQKLVDDEGAFITRRLLDKIVGCNCQFTGNGVIAQPGGLTTEHELFTRNRKIDLFRSALIQFNPPNNINIM